MITDRLIKIAKSAALRSDGVGSNKNYRVGAVLFRKKQIFAAYPNSYRTHPALATLTSYPHLHAESNTIIHHGMDNCEGLNLLVVRVRKPNDQLVMACPCKVCQELISDVKIKRVFYSDWNGHIERLK